MALGLVYYVKQQYTVDRTGHLVTSNISWLDPLPLSGVLGCDTPAPNCVKACSGYSGLHNRYNGALTETW